MASHLFRAARTIKQGSRKFSQLAGKEFEAAIKAEEEHAKSTSSTWKNISLFAAIPGMIACAYNAYTTEQEHIAHHERLEFKEYEHLRIRRVPFPWKDGNHSLFHSHANALPAGYED